MLLYAEHACDEAQVGFLTRAQVNEVHRSAGQTFGDLANAGSLLVGVSAGQTWSRNFGWAAATGCTWSF